MSLVQSSCCTLHFFFVAGSTPFLSCRCSTSCRAGPPLKPEGADLPRDLIPPPLSLYLDLKSREQYKKEVQRRERRAMSSRNPQLTSPSHFLVEMGGVENFQGKGMAFGITPQHLEGLGPALLSHSIIYTYICLCLDLVYNENNCLVLREMFV